MGKKQASILDELRRLICRAEKKGITRYQLCKESGMNEGNLSRFMRDDEMTLNITTVSRLAEALGYDLRFAKKSLVRKQAPR